MQFIRTSGQYLLVPYSASLVFTTAFTVSAWVNPSAATMQRVISRASSQSTDTEIFGLDVMQNNARLMMGKMTNTGFLGAAQYSVDTCAGGSVPSGVWSHIAGTWDGSTMRVYVNGVMVNSVTRTIAPIVSSTPISIGADYPTANGVKEFFDGMLEDIRLYRRALTSNDIQTMFVLRSIDGMVGDLLLHLPLINGDPSSTLTANSTVDDFGPGKNNARTALTGMKYGYSYMGGRFG